MEKHLISVQSGDWYDESDHEKSMAFAKQCGIEAIDFNIDHVISPREYVNGKKYPLCDLSVEEFVGYFAPLKQAAEKYGIAFSQMHAPFPTWFEDKEEEVAAGRMEIGYIVKENMILSQMAEMYIGELKKYLGTIQN